MVLRVSPLLSFVRISKFARCVMVTDDKTIEGNW